MTRPIDWSLFDKYPEFTCECACGTIYRSHSKYILSRGLVARKPCPTCKRDDALRKASSDAEVMTLGSDEKRGAT